MPRLHVRHVAGTFVVLAGTFVVSSTSPSLQRQVAGTFVVSSTCEEPSETSSWDI